MKWQKSVLQVHDKKDKKKFEFRWIKLRVPESSALNPVDIPELVKTALASAHGIAEIDSQGRVVCDVDRDVNDLVKDVEIAVAAKKGGRAKVKGL